MDKKKNTLSSIKTTVIALVLVIIVLVYFNHLSNKSSQERTKRVETEVEQLINYDMLGEYPKTPRDVVKMHCRYFKIFYSESLSDDELVLLNQQVRHLYSKELLSYNPENINLNELKDNIEEMKKEKYSYRVYELPEASQIKEYTQNGVNMATMEITVTLDMDDSMGYMYIQYVLVEEDGKWKIQGWGESRLGAGN